MPPLPKDKPTKKSPVRGTSLVTALSNQQLAISCGSQNFMLHGGKEKRENRKARLRKRLDQQKKEERGQTPPRSFLKRQKNQRCKAPGRLCCPLGNITGLGASPFILVCSAGEPPGVTAIQDFFPLNSRGDAAAAGAGPGREPHQWGFPAQRSADP